MIQLNFIKNSIMNNFSECSCSSCGNFSFKKYEFMEAVDKLISERYPDENAPGCALLVKFGDEIIFEKGWGLTNLETKEKITPLTNFRIASVSKQFTAMTILILAEKGKLNLSDTLDRFFPELPAWVYRIKVENLLQHTSGLPDYEDILPEGDFQVHDEDVVKILTKVDNLLTPPGTAYHYSNTGYSILAMIVERISGMPFYEFAKKEIFSKIGMNNSLYFLKDKNEVSNRAYGYKFIEGQYKFADQGRTSAVLGDGGIYTSVHEYTKWDEALNAGKLISKELLEKAYTKGKLADGSEINYGYGWRFDQRNGMRVVCHTGSTTGFNTNARRIPEKKLCIVMFTNRNGKEPEELVPAIEELFFKFI